MLELLFVVIFEVFCGKEQTMFWRWFLVLLLAASVMSFVAPVAADVDPSFVCRDIADCIELNHYYDEKGELRFSQIIFWDWNDRLGRYEVVTWRMYKSETLFPFRHRHGGFVSRWWDGARLRQVRASSRRFTWSQHDPEIEDRRILPQEKRRGLSEGSR